MKQKRINLMTIVILILVSSCGTDIEIVPGETVSFSEVIGTFPEDKNEILLINEKFYSALINHSEHGELKLEKAFNSIRTYEPIFYSVFRGGVNRKIKNSHLSGGDFSKTTHYFDYDYYFYYFQNYQGMFEITLPDIPYRISAKWYSTDTMFYHTSDQVTNMTINKTAYIVQDKVDSSIYLLNGKFKMINISNLLSENQTLFENRDVEFFREILNNLVLKNCSDNLNNLYDPNKWWSNDVLTSVVDNQTNVKPILYHNRLNYPNTQVKFQTKEISYIPVKFFSKRTDRDALKTARIDNVYGVNQFFMDHDLTSGYVHPFTQNFLNMLDDNGFVMCFKRSPNRINEAIAYYKRKKDLDPNDILGENIAFCRQWKLSEINMKNDDVLLKTCKFNSRCNCLQVKEGSDNPYSPEIPLWSTYRSENYVDINELNKFGDFDGGSVVIIWENDNKEILFKDIYGSIYDIITTAREIRDKYNTDPVIGIYDAGSYARRFQSNNGVLDVELINRNTGTGKFVGAGYGYLIE